MVDCYAFWGKIPIDLENNIQYDKQAPHNHINNPMLDTIDRDQVMLLRNNMRQTADGFFLDQCIAT